MAGVPQTAADLLQRPHRLLWANCRHKPREAPGRVRESLSDEPVLSRAYSEHDIAASSVYSGSAGQIGPGKGQKAMALAMPFPDARRGMHSQFGSRTGNSIEVRGKLPPREFGRRGGALTPREPSSMARGEPTTSFPVGRCCSSQEILSVEDRLGSDSAVVLTRLLRQLIPR